MTFGPTVGYPVDVGRDLVLIYNTNSAGSIWVKDYYRAHRPMISNATVLAVGCPTGEFMTTNEFFSQLNAPWQDWLTAHPTIRPRYIVLFLDVPSRMSDMHFPGINGSVSFNLHDQTLGIKPFVTHIHMGDTNACRAYIDKLEFFGTNYSPGHVILSASAGSYGNTDYYFDGAVSPTNLNQAADMAAARDAVITAGISANLVHFNDSTNNFLAAATNVAGYLSQGIYAHPIADTNRHNYAIDGRIAFSGNSRWYIMNTRESFNGQVAQEGAQGNFIKWFSSNAFGGANFSNTPVGAITHTSEPSAGINKSVPYFPLWVTGGNFATCAWAVQVNNGFQAVGDPLVRR
jgi:hypothetical protein